jgi:hypothetical protein
MPLGTVPHPAEMASIKAETLVREETVAIAETITHAVHHLPLAHAATAIRTDHEKAAERDHRTAEMPAQHLMTTVPQVEADPARRS